MEDIKSRLGEIAYANAKNKDSDSKGLVLSLIEDLKRAEENLIAEYEQFNEIINR